MVMHPACPGVLYMQLHQGGGVFRSDKAGEKWQEVKGNLPSDFGFPIEVHAHEPETVYVITMNPMLRVPIEGKLTVWRSRTGGKEWEPIPLERAMEMVADRVHRTRETTWEERSKQGHTLRRTLGIAQHRAENHRCEGSRQNVHGEDPLP